MKAKIKRFSEFSKTMQWYLRLLTKIQRVLLRKRWYGVYYFVTNLHFMAYFEGRDLRHSVKNNTPEGQAALRRHGRMAAKEMGLILIKSRLEQAGVSDTSCLSEFPYHNDIEKILSTPEVKKFYEFAMLKMKVDMDR